MIKIVIATVLLVFIAGCGKESEDSKNTIDQNLGEHKSAHESDWEKYSDRTSDNAVNGNYQIFIEENINITDKNIGSFKSPKFTKDGNKVVFTNENYSQIWLYDLSEKKMDKIVEMPQCGFHYQLADNSDEIFFRNSVSSGKVGEKIYSIMKYSISKMKIEQVYTSKKRISWLSLVNDNLYFLENDTPKSLNTNSKLINEKFAIPYFFVKDNILHKVLEKVDTIQINQQTYNFISCEYSKDAETIFVLTGKNGILAIDLNGKLINNFKDASSISKLYKSNLVVFTEETDDGMKIINSKLKFGFLNLPNIMGVVKEFNQPVFNPDWSPVANRIVYSTDNGKINIISFNIEKQTQ